MRKLFPTFGLYPSGGSTQVRGRYAQWNKKQLKINNGKHNYKNIWPILEEGSR